MFGVLPAVIDPIQLADEGITLEGELSLEGMPRLRELCRNPQGRVRVSLRFERSAQGIRKVEGRIVTSLDLTCQRCLQTVSQELGIATQLLLVRPGESQAGLPEEADVLEVTAPVPLSAMVEDELLLALPMTPRHTQGACAPAAIGKPGKRAPAEQPQAPASPFAVLESLKRKD